MTYRNTDNTVLSRVLIREAPIGTQVVFHNDGMVEDIHEVRAFDGDTVITIVRVDDMTGANNRHTFAHNHNRPCYILKHKPSRQDLLFDE